MKIRSLFKKELDKEESKLYDNSAIKVLWVGCIAIVIALLFMSITSMLITNNAVVEKLKKVDLKNMAGSIASTIDGRVEKAVDASLMLSSDPMIINWIKSSNTDETTGKITEEKMREMVDFFGYDTTFLTSAITNQYWSYADGKYELLDVVSQEDPDDKWFFDSISMNKRYEINIDHNKELNDTFVWINTLVGDVSKPIAVTGIGMNLDDVIDSLIEEGQNELENNILLVDRSGIIHLSKNQEYLGKPLTDYLPEQLAASIIYTQNKASSFKSMEYTNDAGDLYDIAYKTIKDTDWKLIVEIPRSESLGFMRTIIINTVLACLFIIVLMLIMLNLLTVKIANPYKRALQLNQELENKVQERTRELNEKNNNIQDSIEVAKRIQENILTSENEMEHIFEEYFIIWEPRDIVGGDFYWIKKFNDGLLVVVGDCTGHGVPGALMTTAVNAMLNHIVDEKCHDNPAIILQELDGLLRQSLTKNDAFSDIQDGLDAGIVYISTEKEILFSGAQFSLMVSDENGVREVKGNRNTIDCIARNEECIFENLIIEHTRDMSLYLVTDGFTDQPGGEKGLPYGKSRVLSELQMITKMKMAQQKEKLRDSFREYRKSEMIRDDVTILGFKIK